MFLKCSDIINFIEVLAPCRLAEDWDNPGLQVGDPGAQVKRVMLTLDVDLTVADEARKDNIDMIISHHPVIFKPLSSINLARQDGQLMFFLIKNNIAVYAAHTNLDVAGEGVSQVLAEKLKLRNINILYRSGQEGYSKIAVFVPIEHAGTVRCAMSNAGAGSIGNYDNCTFMTRGAGTFRPLYGASPYIGKENELVQIEEIRLEAVVSHEKAGDVIEAMLEAHPYEKPAYDLYSLEKPCNPYGPGRVGRLDEPMPLCIFADRVKDVLEVSVLRLGGPLNNMVQTVAVCGGSGADLWEFARHAGADTIVTGDIRYHSAREILSAGLNFVDPGHYSTEVVILPSLREYLLECGRKSGLELEVTISKTVTEPFLFY